MTDESLQRISGDPLVDLELLQVRRSLKEVFRNAETAGFEEPTGFVCDTQFPLARRIAEHVFVPGALEEAERVAQRLIACVPRHDLGYALDQVSREACLLLRDVPLDDDALWNVVLLGEHCTVVTVQWRILLDANAQIVVARARQAQKRFQRKKPSPG